MSTLTDDPINEQNVTKEVTIDVTKEVTIETKILTLLKEGTVTTTTEMADALNVNRRTIQRGLDELRKLGYVERVGGRRYGHWEVH